MHHNSGTHLLNLLCITKRTQCKKEGCATQHHTANPYRLSQNEITGQLRCLDLLALSYMLLFTCSPHCHMPVSARLRIAVPTKGYSACCRFGCMFPFPMCCGAGLGAGICVMPVLCRGEMRLKKIFPETIKFWWG